MVSLVSSRKKSHSLQKFSDLIQIRLCLFFLLM
nr:MAG TPA: hypothetical protein [Caudoviricetes sp.]